MRPSDRSSMQRFSSRNVASSANSKSTAMVRPAERAASARTPSAEAPSGFSLKTASPETPKAPASAASFAAGGSANDTASSSRSRSSSSPAQAQGIWRRAADSSARARLRPAIATISTPGTARNAGTWTSAPNPSPATATLKGRSDNARLGKRDDESAAIALLPEVRDELVGDMPGEEHRVLGLVGEELLLVEHGDARSRDIFPELVRGRDLEHAVENPVVERRVIDERARAGRRADAVDAGAFALERRQEPVKLELRLQDARTEIGKCRAARDAARLLVGEPFSDARQHAPAPRPRGIDPDRASMRRNPLHMEDFEPVLLQEPFQAAEMIVAKMLVIDRVVLKHLDEIDEIVRFRHEHAVGSEKIDDPGDDLVDAADMGEDVGGRDEPRHAVLRLHRARGLASEIGGERIDAA